jgi:MtN3 and saliva related transmembrane protein
MGDELKQKHLSLIHPSPFIPWNQGVKMTEAVGWASSIILVLTIAKQVYKQWHEGSSEGVSKWLFIGQMAASLGFTIYSWLVNNWVFVVTNSLMLLNGLAGLGIVLHHRRREQLKG